jgi:tight adherence protein B
MRLTALLAAASAASALACWPPAPGARLRTVSGRPRPGLGHWAAAAALGQIAALVLGVPWAAGGVLAAAVATKTVFRRARLRRERRMRRAATVEAVYALASELRAGRTPAQALDAAAQSIAVLAEPLAAAARAVRGGAQAADPLRAVGGLEGCEALMAVAAVWHVTENAGGAVADVLQRLGSTLDADAADRRTFEAALAGPRASMALLAGLPVLGLAMAQTAGAHPLRLLLHWPLGWALLAGAVALELLGLAWSRRLARGVLAA